MKFWALALFALISVQAFAQEATPTSAPICTPTTAALPTLNEPQPSLPKKDPRRALRLSLGTTLGGGAILLGGVVADGLRLDGVFGASMALGSTAMLVGPSVGHFYNRSYRRGIWTSLLRAGLPIAGAFVGSSIEIAFINSEGGALGAGFAGAVYGGTIGLAASTALAVYDIIDAPRSVLRGGHQRLRRTPPSAE